MGADEAARVEAAREAGVAEGERVASLESQLALDAARAADLEARVEEARVAHIEGAFIHLSTVTFRAHAAHNSTRSPSHVYL